MHVHRTGSCSTLGDMTGIGSGSGDMASGVTRAAGDVFGGGSAASATSAGRGEPALSECTSVLYLASCTSVLYSDDAS